MIRPVPPESAGGYLNLMGCSWLLNIFICMYFFGTIPSAFGFFWLTFLTDFMWWATNPDVDR